MDKITAPPPPLGSSRLRPGAWAWLAAVLAGLLVFAAAGSGNFPVGKVPPVETEQLDLQTASVREFTSLPGIGGRLAERIVRLRQEQGTIRFEDLRRVKGIGPAKMRRLREWVTTLGEDNGHE